MKNNNAKLSKISIKVIDFEIPSNNAEKLPNDDTLDYENYLKKIKKLGAKKIEEKESITLYSQNHDRLVIIKELIIQMLIKWKEIYTNDKLLSLVKSNLLEERSIEKENYLEDVRFSQFIEKDEESYDSWVPKKGIQEDIVDNIIESYKIFEVVEGIDDWKWGYAISEYWWNP